MEGRAGAERTQARTPNCMSPPPGAPPSTFYGFRVLSNSACAPVLLFVFCTCLEPSGARRGLSLARGFLRVFKLSFAWRSSSLEPVGPVQTRRVQGLVGSGSGSRPLVLFKHRLCKRPENGASRPGPRRRLGTSEIPQAFWERQPEAAEAPRTLAALKNFAGRPWEPRKALGSPRLRSQKPTQRAKTGGIWEHCRSPDGFSAFALLDGPGLTQY